MTREPVAAPARTELRDFGLVLGAAFAGLFGFALPLLKHHPIPLWPWIVAAALVVPALAWPPALKWPHFLWTKLSRVLGWINQRIVLTILFYVVLMPTGMLMRLFGRDPMARGFDRRAASYRVTSRRPPPRAMERPF